MSTPHDPGALPAAPRSWSADILKIHMDEKLHDLRSALSELRSADSTAVSAALAAAEKAVTTALAAQEKASLKNDAEVEKWRENANEWREAMNDRETKFMTIAIHEAYAAGVTLRVDAIAARVALIEQWQNQAIGKSAAFFGLIAFAFAAVTIALRFL